MSKNDIRLRFALEAGLNPVFVDSTNLRLWEMRSSVLLADRLGYVTHIVDASQIHPKWNDVEQVLAMDTNLAKSADGRAKLASMIAAYEPVVNALDPLIEIRSAKRMHDRFVGTRLEAPISNPLPGGWVKAKKELADDRKRHPEPNILPTLPAKVPRVAVSGSGVH